jgi:predicted adenine nucleotide alpha hydrolase (AANH) superfamily ATPase
MYLKARNFFYGNSNISPCKKYNLKKKNRLKETKMLQDNIITLQPISSFNTSQNIIFQKILIKKKRPTYFIPRGPKSLKLL